MNNNYKNKALHLIIMIFLLLIGIVAFNFPEVVTFIFAATYLLISLIVGLYCAYYKNPFLDNWMLWLQFFIFILFGLSVSLAIFGVYDYRLLIDMQTSFANSVRESSYILAMIISAIASLILSICYQVDSTSSVRLLPLQNRRIELVGKWIIYLTLPACLYVAFYNFKAILDIGYVALYSSQFREDVAPFPYYYLFTNLNTLGFMLFFSSVPTEREFKRIALLFLALKLAESLVGARGVFVLSLFAITWLWAHTYGGKAIPVRTMLSAASLVFVFSMLMKASRSENDEFSISAIFIGVMLVSKGLDIVALYIDNLEYLGGRNSFILAPLLFPLKYLQTNGLVVGQSELSAATRDELGHVLSSTLNMGAYMQGAGTGSSFIAECFQYGFLLFFVLVYFFYIFYRTFFKLLKYRIVFAFSIIIIQQLMFAPRDSFFPNSMLFIKYAPLLLIIFLVLQSFRGVKRPMNGC